MKRAAAVLVLAVLLAAQTVRLTIQHVVQNCHIWKLGTKSLGPSTKITVARGARVVIRSDCPMDFDLAQLKGPKLALGDPRLYTGQSTTIVFRTAGTYRLIVTAANHVTTVRSPIQPGASGAEATLPESAAQ